MPAAATINIEIKQGATFRKAMVYKNRLRKPYDLTGFSARMQIRDAAGSLVATLTTENRGIVLSAVPGGIDWFISDEATAQMNFASATYDMYLDAPNGDAIWFATGKVIFIKGQIQ